MPVQHAIWTVGVNPVPLPIGKLPSEQLLEEMIIAAPEILSAEWMLIGRQEQTGMGGRIDLLAIAPDASLVLIELKRERTPREIVAQALDYACWVADLTSERISQIYQRFSNGDNLSQAFKDHFGSELDEDALNQSHQIILVAAELDNSTERIVGYLNARDIAINVVFFSVFQHGTSQILSRAWLIDPGETQANVATSSTPKGDKEPWNGEFYVSFGSGPSRTWAEARKYGYVSAGGKPWYSQTLKTLSPGDRVWVNDPSVGYVGVGRVSEPVVPSREFVVRTENGDQPCLDVLSTAPKLIVQAQSPENEEYFVRVEWLDSVESAQAVREVGLFGNQNTVCQPRTPKWRHTVERLKTFFPKWDCE